MGEFIQLVPDASNLIESQRSVGYTFETAIADIIDNSVSAQAKTIEIIADHNGKFLAILDDGYGMDADELVQAMKYGSKSSSLERDKDDLGRFGLGLKMASFSQCRKLTVLSSKDGVISGAVWDLDIIRDKDSWLIERLSVEQIKKVVKFDELAELSSGTLVIWEKFDKFEQQANYQDNFDEALDRTENHLSLVFHRFIQDKEIKILLNQRQIEAVDPFFTSNKATQLKTPDMIFEKNRNARIDVQPYIIPYKNRLTQKEKYILKKYESSNLDQGLYIYRNRRLIAWGKWFKLVRTNELANLAKVQIDIPNTMDDLWQIDVKKSQLIIPSSIREQLRNIIKKSIGESEKVYKHRGTVRNKDKSVQYIFDRLEKANEISYQINMDNPLIKQLQANLIDSDNRLLSMLIKQIETHLPFESIRYDMASNNKNIEIESSSEDEVYENIMLILSNQKSKQSKLSLLEKLQYMEDFVGQKDILKRVEEELNG